MSLFTLDPASTARGCSCLLPSNDRVVPHQPHRTFTRANDRHAARLPDARRDQWYRTHADHKRRIRHFAAECSSKPVEFVRVGPSEYSSWLVVPVAIQTTGWFHSPTAWTFTRSDGRHVAQLPDARRDRWCCTHADHSAESDTMQLTAAHNRPTEPQQTRSPLHQHEEQYSNTATPMPTPMPPTMPLSLLPMRCRRPCQAGFKA